MGLIGRDVGQGWDWDMTEHVPPSDRCLFVEYWVLWAFERDEKMALRGFGVGKVAPSPTGRGLCPGRARAERGMTLCWLFSDADRSRCRFHDLGMEGAAFSSGEEKDDWRGDEDG